MITKMFVCLFTYLFFLEIACAWVGSGVERGEGEKES